MEPRDAIILAEEDASTIELYTRELSRDFRVQACTDATEMLSLVRSDRVRAVVLEPALARGAGWQLFAAIAAECQARHVPIVVCSTLDERRRGFHLGATAYLVKPTLPAALRAAVRDVIPEP